MSEQHHFQSKDLQEVYENSRNTLENIAVIQDQISQDIKTLEKYLGKIGFSEHFIYQIDHGFVAEDDGSLPMSLVLDICGKFCRELLIWDPELKRLLYSSEEQRASLCTDERKYHFDGDYTEITPKKPLIETKFQIRKKMFAHLPKFLNLIAEQYL